MIKSISIHQVASLIKREQINFIGTAISPWHAHGIDCCILNLLDKGVEVNGIIIIEMHNISGYIIDKSNFKNNCCSFYYLKKNKFEGFYAESNYFLNKFKSLYNNINQEFTHDLYVASPWHINLNLFKYIVDQLNRKNFKFYVFDEGLSTYFSSSESLFAIWRDSGLNKTLFEQILSFIYRFLNFYTDKFLEKNISYTNMNIFLRKKNVLCLNHKSIKYYESFLKNNYQCNSKKYSFLNNNTVIICTMAISSDEMDLDGYIKFLKGIISFLKKLNKNIVIKPHPRESDYKNKYSKLDCILFDDNDYSLESVLVNYQIDALIGFSSTSLVTSSIFFECNSISLVNMFNVRCFDVKIRKEIKDFKSIFSSFVSFPNGYFELEKIISKKPQSS